MINFKCDRCDKPLAEGDGYSFGVGPRMKRFPDGRIEVTQNLDNPFRGELCNGCYDLMYFFLNQRFRDGGKVIAG